MSPALELQGALVPRLKERLGAMVEERVYDHVPRSATTGVVTADFPFVGLGLWSEVEAGADCIAASEIEGRIECWSRKPGKREAMEIAEAVKVSLHEAEIELTANALVHLTWIRTDVITDPDGLTAHATVEFQALVEQP